MNLPINQIKTILDCMASDPNVSTGFIEEFFTKFLIGKSLPIFKDFPLNFVVRASLNNYEKGEIFTNVGRCSYNPFKENIQLQRCNYEQQQVFYAAVPAKGKQVNALKTALLETSIDLAKDESINRRYFTLSRWKAINSLNLVVLPFTKRSSRRNIDFRQMNKKFDKILKEVVKNDLYLYNYFHEFLKYMSDVFCKKKNKLMYYKISSAFFNSLINFGRFYNEDFKSSSIHIDGIIYPSANTKAEGMNIALIKDVIDRKDIFCDLVIMYSMLRRPNNSKYVDFLDASREQVPNKEGIFNFKNVW